MVEKCDQLLSRYVSPPLIWEQFSHLSYLYSLVIGMQKYEITEKKLKNERLDAYLRNLHNFEILWRISQDFIGSKVPAIGPLRFLRSNIYLIFCDNLVRALFWLFG